MTDEEKIIFNKDVRKVQYSFIIIFVTLILVGSIVQRCNSDKYQQLKGEYKQLNIDYLKQKDGVVNSEKIRIIEKKALDKEIKKREEVNNELTLSNKELQSRINIIQNRKTNIPKNTPCYDLAVKVEEGQKCIEIIPLKDEIIENQSTQITNLEKDKVTIKTELTTAEKEIEDRKLLQEAGEKNIDNLKTQTKTLNRKNIINKILIPVVAIAGTVIGYKLAK